MSVVGSTPSRPNRPVDEGTATLTLQDSFHPTAGLNRRGMMERALAQADAKPSLTFNLVEIFPNEDPLFATLMAAEGDAIGQGTGKCFFGPSAETRLVLAWDAPGWR